MLVQYSDGSPVQVGDHVLVENGSTPAVVKNFIASPAQLAEWGVNEPGVMLESSPFGLLFISFRLLAEEPLVRSGSA